MPAFVFLSPILLSSVFVYLLELTARWQWSSKYCLGTGKCDRLPDVCLSCADDSRVGVLPIISHLNPGEDHEHFAS